MGNFHDSIVDCEEVYYVFRPAGLVWEPLV